MANDEHVAKLLEDVEAWNEWRNENPDVVVDLEGASLQEANLMGAKLQEPNLE